MKFVYNIYIYRYVCMHIRARARAQARAIKFYLKIVFIWKYRVLRIKVVWILYDIKIFYVIRDIIFAMCF